MRKFHLRVTKYDLLLVVIFCSFYVFFIRSSIGEEKTVENVQNFVLNISYQNQELISDTERKYARPWKRDPECREHKTYFSKKNTLSPCALASYPGSGNTWTRFLIESATGIFTSSNTHDGLLQASGFLGEMEPLDVGTTIVQKSHTFSPKVIKGFNYTAILLIRNPYKAVLSHYNFLYSDHKLYAPTVTYRSKDWIPFVNFGVKTWINTCKSWIKEGKNILVVHYEDLTHNAIFEIERILRFLNISIDEERKQCLLKHINGNFKRKSQQFPDNLELFPSPLMQKIDKAIDYMDLVLKNRGHPQPPINQYEFYKGNPSHVQTVPCKKNESTIQCDERIDSINLENFNPFSKENKEELTSPDVLTWLISKVSKKLGNYKQKVGLTAVKNYMKSSEKQNLEEEADTKKN